MVTTRHPVERAIEWGSAALLSFAAGFFVRAAVGGTDEVLALAGSIAAALAAGGTALSLLRKMESPRWVQAAFDPSPIEEDTAESRSHDELLLTDPLETPDEDSRIVRLFAPATLHMPGELAGRIDQWLDGARSRLVDRETPMTGHGPAASPASAALHAALADIRRSLG